jgi:hypothetical protein
MPITARRLQFSAGHFPDVFDRPGFRWHHAWPMTKKDKQGKKMRLGPGWKLTRKGQKFTGTLRANIHIGEGKMIAIFAMRARKTKG